MAKGDDDETDEAEDDKKYCVCGGPGDGDMVQCGADGCERDWFHLECVGFDEAPGKEGEF